jgi:hypothetical protein
LVVHTSSSTLESIRRYPIHVQWDCRLLLSRLQADAVQTYYISNTFVQWDYILLLLMPR